MQEKRILKSMQYIIQHYGFGGLFNSIHIKIVRTSWQSAVSLMIMDMFGALPKNMQM